MKEVRSFQKSQNVCSKHRFVIGRRDLILGGGSILTAAALSTLSGFATEQGIDLTATEAQKIARDAYIFAFPLNYYYRTIYSQIADPNNKKGLGGFGKWRHDGLATPADKETTMPNNDTPYSWAWVDLRSEPWVLVQPPADGDRFYSSVWGDLFAHIVDYPGSTNDGQKGGTYLLAPTSWKGEPPSGVNRVIRGETTILGTLTRTAVFGEQRHPEHGEDLTELPAHAAERIPEATRTTDRAEARLADLERS